MQCFHFKCVFRVKTNATKTHTRLPSRPKRYSLSWRKSSRAFKAAGNHCTLILLESALWGRITINSTALENDRLLRSINTVESWINLTWHGVDFLTEMWGSAARWTQKEWCIEVNRWPPFFSLLERSFHFGGMCVLNLIRGSQVVRAKSAQGKTWENYCFFKKKKQQLQQKT